MPFPALAAPAIPARVRTVVLMVLGKLLLIAVFARVVQRCFPAVR